MAEEVSTEPKVAVITGASSGIGRATALKFAEKGYHVVLGARRKDELDEVAREAEEFGIQTVTVTTDVTSDKAVHELGEAAVKTFGRVDVWINNAGVYMVGKFQDLPLEDMRRLMDVNFFGYVHGSQTALELFEQAGHGTLINVSSINATAPMPYVSVYSASKAAVRAFDDALRMELQLEGMENRIRVCTVMPASVDTNLFQNSANFSGSEVQALEPVYDANYVAKQIVRLAERPRHEILVGPSARLMALQRSLAPRMYEKRFSRYTQADLLGDEEMPDSDGNLYDPITSNRGTSGGWRETRMRGDQMNIMAGALAAGVTAAVIGLGLLSYRTAKAKKRS